MRTLACFLALLLLAGPLSAAESSAELLKELENERISSASRRRLKEKINLLLSQIRSLETQIADLADNQLKTEAALRESDEALRAAAGIFAESEETARSAVDEVGTIGEGTGRVGQLLDRLEDRIAEDPGQPVD